MSTKKHPLKSKLGHVPPDSATWVDRIVYRTYRTPAVLAGASGRLFMRFWSAMWKVPADASVQVVPSTEVSTLYPPTLEEPSSPHVPVGLMAIPLMFTAAGSLTTVVMGFSVLSGLNAVNQHSYALVFNDDGTFEVPNVLPGSYTVHLSPTDPRQPNNYRTLASQSTQVTVPEGEGTFDVGVIKLALNQ